MRLFNKKKDNIKKTIDELRPKTVVKNKITEESTTPRVDMSLVFAKLKGLSSPYAMQRGKIVIFRELQSILAMFTEDKEFMALINKDK